VNSSAGSERYTHSSSSATSAALTPERRITSLLIMAREATANTGGPLISNLTPRRSAGGILVRLEANARRMAWHAACCASVSEPAART